MPERDANLERQLAKLADADTYGCVSDDNIKYLLARSQQAGDLETAMEECIPLLHREAQSIRDEFARFAKQNLVPLNTAYLSEKVTQLEAALASARRAKEGEGMSKAGQAYMTELREAQLSIRRLEAELAALRRERDDLIAAFLHMFVSDPNDKPHHETCFECGLNIRSLVHEC